MADTLANVKTYEGIIGCELTSDNIIPMINALIKDQRNYIKANQLVKALLFIT